VDKMTKKEQIENLKNWIQSYESDPKKDEENPNRLFMKKVYKAKIECLKEIEGGK
jgi:hypothetical protein